MMFGQIGLGGGRPQSTGAPVETQDILADYQNPVFYEVGIPLVYELNFALPVPDLGGFVSYSLAPDQVLPAGLTLGVLQVDPELPPTFRISGNPTAMHPDGMYAPIVIRLTYRGFTKDWVLPLAHVSLDRDAVISGGTEFDFTPFGSSGPNVPHRRYIFDASGTLNVLQSGWLTYAIAGGGGGGGASSGLGGAAGGGAGGFRTERIWRPAGNHTVTIGAGGASGTAGGNTSFQGSGGFDRTIGGGTAGAAANSSTSGSAGVQTGSGSAGGSSAGTSTAAVRGAAFDQRWGSDGGVGLANAGGGMAGGGGGHAGRGGDAAGTVNSGHGGAGVKLHFGTGVGSQLLLCCGGGAGARNGGVAGVAGHFGQMGSTGGAGGAAGAVGEAGMANRGNGGGGAGGFTSGSRLGGAGGSGIAIFWTKRP